MKRKQAEQIFDAVYNKTYGEAYGYIFSKTGDIHAAPEILSDSYTAFYKHLLSLKIDDIENKRSYLFSIIRSNLATYYKAQAGRNEIIEDIDGEFDALLARELQAEVPNVTDKAEAKILIGKIMDYIAQKPLAVRRAFVLHFMFGFTIDQVAKELSVTRSCAANYIYRLTAEIRKQFAAEYCE